MMRIYPIRTGSVQIKRAQLKRRPGGFFRVLTDPEWTEWLPIYAWLIDHPEGPILVDTGETARTREPGYFPRWHPYYRWAVSMDVKPDEELGPRLRALGIGVRDIQTVVLTHCHTDHAGGLRHISDSRHILVSATERALARGVSGKMRGYLPHRWPTRCDLETIAFTPTPDGPFSGVCVLTRTGDVSIVPTPGHTPGHVSVLVKDEGITYLLAGDASYHEQALIERAPDGVTLNPALAVQTLERILQYAKTEPLVYLPAHDPLSTARLGARQVVPRGADIARSA
ncbi:MAG: N-acyl homoserine lactonase family protein [Acidiferrobacteraceae bacterium]